jgi:8-oxo-dGTP diphosphatase
MNFKDSHGNTVSLPKGREVAWRISGYAIIQNKKGQFLMIQSGSGLWHFPGGGIESNETISAGIRREYLEETGYQVTVDPTVKFSNEQYFYHKREQEFYHSVQLFFTGNLVDLHPNVKVIKDQDMERKVSWIDLADIQTDQIHETVREIINRLKA